MKKILIPFLSLCFGPTCMLAQYSIDWIHPSGDFQKTGVMITRDKLDNVAVTGYWNAYNIFTRKYDKFGNQQWENTSSSGVASNYEKAVWINCDSSNNVIVTGYRYTVGTYHYPNALVVIKYDPAGALLWKSTIPMTLFVNHLVSFNMRSEIDNNGNIYIGTVAVSPAGFVLLKMDAAGNILFTNSDNSNAVSVFRSMRLVGSHVLMCGGVPVTNNANAICWDTSGTVAWNTILSGNSGVDIDMDETGDCYLLTSLDNQVNPTSLQDIKIYKLNSSGTQLAVNNYDFGGNDFPTRFMYAGGRISIIGGSSISSGYFDWITFQINGVGTKLWDSRYNETSINDEYPYGLTAKSNGEVFVTGRGGPDHIIFGSSYLRMITLKYDNTGTRKWVDSVNVNYGWGRAIALALDNSLYVVSDAYTTAFHFLDHNGTPPASIPASVTVSGISTNSATFIWSSVPGAYLYHLRYKKNTDLAWTVKSTNNTYLMVNGLTENTTYEYSCEAINEGGPSGYSPVQIFITSIALPAIGLELTAKPAGLKIILDWVTQTEINTDFFEIQKSYDGLNFTTIGTEAAAGNSVSTKRYQYVDTDSRRALVFYRVKLVDLDARFHMSDVRTISPANEFKELYLFPNPATSSVTLLLNETSRENWILTIFNSSGQIVRKNSIAFGARSINIKTSSLPPGIYFIKIYERQKLMVTGKLLIQ